MDGCYQAFKHLFNQIDTGQQVHTEIDKVPVNTLLLVLLLFQDEHVMVKELLQFLIGEVNTQLFEAVVLHSDLGIFTNYTRNLISKG